MIPLHKLERLPRSQRLRKIAKIVAEAELDTVSRNRRLGWTEIEALAKMAKLLAGDEIFSEAARKSFLDASSELSEALLDDTGDLPRRPVNTMRHLLNREIGIQVADWDLVDGSGSLSRDERLTFQGVRVFLEDIRSPYNVGSIFRTAESFGVEKILISPLCAPPEHPRARRSAMGCVDIVHWERAELSALSGPIFALETGGTPVDEFQFPEMGTMLVGSEELGVSPPALSLADGSAGRITIPTYGLKGSLNVAVAFGIAMRAWAKSVVNDPENSPT